MVFNYIKESEMESKEKIASFIEYHNIIRPIEYPLFAVPFLSIIMSVLYLIGCFSEYKYSTAREVCIVGLICSTICFFVSMKLRRICLQMLPRNPGKGMYSAEIIQYVGLIFHSVIYIEFVVSWWKREICLLVAILFIMLLISVLICATVWIIKYRINKGIYLNKKRIDFNKVAIFSSTSFISVVFIFKSIVLNNLDSNMPVLILLMLISCMIISVILSTAYYLKLKYAKEYGLEEYLPRRPNPSKYTGWK
jgi:membrane protein